MDNNKVPTERANKNRILNVLRLLWARFLRQNLIGKVITLGFLILTLIIAVLFFAGVIIWVLVKFVLFRVFLALAEWYLEKTEPSPRQ